MKINLEVNHLVLFLAACFVIPGIIIIWIKLGLLVAFGVLLVAIGSNIRQS